MVEKKVSQVIISKLASVVIVSSRCKREFYMFYMKLKFGIFVGEGLFTKNPLKKGDLVAAYNGFKISIDEVRYVSFLFWNKR